jgi:hypothetical protein
VLVVPRGVGHRLAEQLLLAKLDPDPLLEVAQSLQLGLAERRRSFGSRRDRRRGLGGCG